MPNEVYVVTGFELGWDNVVGVYIDVTYQELVAQFPKDQYFIQSHTLLKTVINE